MAYKFLLAGNAISQNPKNDYLLLAQETLNEQFYDSSNWYTIEEETELASGEYQVIDVRIDGVIDSNTGERGSDDFKKLLFKEINHSVELGKMYKFENNYWLSINIEKTDTMYSTVTIRRCNNSLRWMDANGGILQVPCAIGYLIKENRDYSTAGSAMVVPSGMIDVFVQFNQYTNKIIANQRFLFGNASNWIAYRVEGGGIANFNNMKTFDNMSVGLLRYSMAVDYVNLQEDDIANGIANILSMVYSLTLDESSISGSSGQTVQLYSTVSLNGITVNRNVSWSSINETVATVNSTGLVTFVESGSTTITCELVGDEDVKDTCSVTVGASPADNYQIIYSPTSNFVLENNEKTWTVLLYKNSIPQGDTFIFSLDANTVPSENYIYTEIDGNNFKVENVKRYIEDFLEITATSGSHVITIQVKLRGAY